MQFEVIATVEKSVWNNEDTHLYAVIEQGEKPKKWSIFVKQVLTIGAEYKFQGYCSMGKNKTTQQWQTNFNAEKVEPLNGESFPELDTGDDIPF